MKALKKILSVKAVLLVAALSAITFAACNDGVQAAGGGPASEVKPAHIRVALTMDMVQKYVDTMPADDLVYGGWYEPADRPQTAPDPSAPKTSADADTPPKNDYDKIDPKSSLLVYKYFDSVTAQQKAEPGDFTVKLFKDDGTEVVDAENKPTTRIPTYGGHKIKVEWKSDPTLPVKYFDGNPAESKNEIKDKFLPIYAASPHANTEAIAGFSVQKLPHKTEYDWKEPFEGGGLEVIAWYGGTTLDTGMPVIGKIGETFKVDTKNFDTTMKIDNISAKPMASNPPIKLYVKKVDDAITGTASTPSADFDVNLVLKEYTIAAQSSSGTQPDATVDFGNAKRKVTDIVTVTFYKSSSYALNPESVKIQYKGKETTPKLPNLSDDDIHFEWESTSLTLDGDAVDTEKEAVRATFEMPASDVTIVADYIFSSSKLSNITIGSNAASALAIYGFNPNISDYTYLLPAGETSVYVSVDTLISDTPVRFKSTAGTPAASGLNATIDGLETAKDTILTIEVAAGTNPREYKIVIKPIVSNTVEFSYTGAPQTFRPWAAGVYQFEAWGAYGGNSPDFDGNGGNGMGGKPAYTKGRLTMDPNGALWNPAAVSQVDSANVVYIYVGEGGWARDGATPGKATWNGGGAGGLGAGKAGSSGGGATSISLTRGSWSDFQVLLDRIMVAGGGGGYGHNNGRAGAAGGLIAQGGRTDGTQYYTTTGGYWAGAGQAFEKNAEGHDDPGDGGRGFGIGGKGYSPPTNFTLGGDGRGGGGGGYFGGTVNTITGVHSNAGGGGGSSYISGYTGCISYNEHSKSGWMVKVGGSTPADAGASDLTLHYSGRRFTEAAMTALSGINTDTATDTSPASGAAAPAENPGVSSGLGVKGAPNKHGFVRITLIQ
ncbi:MAG: hypothetical protein LBG72_03360 [Spirochaetaceae bacterium]|jgi:hypothetical protein|nr:hypothetical protein [Spirochaetaceae bacterium]